MKNFVTFFLTLLFYQQIGAIVPQESRGLEQFYPPYGMREKLEHLFKGMNIGSRLELESQPTQFLKDLGFTIIQSNFANPSSPFVVESHLLPDYVIKFLRIVAPQHQKVTSGRGSVPIPTMADRVRNAAQLQKIIQDGHLIYVKVPEKYIYPVDDLILLIADKVVPSKRRTNDLNEHEIKEMLHLVAHARGILDFKSANYILSDNAIYFIDTERPESPNWFAQLEKSFKKLKAAVHPKYQTAIDEWWRDEIMHTFYPLVFPPHNH